MAGNHYWWQPLVVVTVIGDVSQIQKEISCRHPFGQRFWFASAIYR